MNFYITAVPGFFDLDLSYLAFQKIIFICMYISAFALGLFVSEFLNRKEPKWFYLTYALILTVVVALFLIAPDLKALNFFGKTL
jgi:hypothetical protein